MLCFINKYCFYLKERQQLMLGLQEINQGFPGLISSAKTSMVRFPLCGCLEIAIACESSIYKLFGFLIWTSFCDIKALSIMCFVLVPVCKTIVSFLELVLLQVSFQRQTPSSSIRARSKYLLSSRETLRLEKLAIRVQIRVMSVWIVYICVAPGLSLFVERQMRHLPHKYTDSIHVIWSIDSSKNLTCSDRPFIFLLKSWCFSCMCKTAVESFSLLNKEHEIDS